MDADQVAHYLGLEEKLSKIRLQVNSKLENQKHVAVILLAVEENIKDVMTQETAKNVVQYMIALMSLLDQCIDISSQRVTDMALASSATYILDLVFGYSPKTLLRSRFAEILTKIAPLITGEETTAPLVKSATGCLEALLISQDAQSWNNTHNLSVTPARGLQGLLELSLDLRPKVRKRAIDAVIKILENPPPAPTREHVASASISSFCLKHLATNLEEISSISNKKSKKRADTNDSSVSKIHNNLKLISKVLETGQWSSLHYETLCDLLLKVTKTPEKYLVSSAFECFENLFKSMVESKEKFGLAENKFLDVLNVLLSLNPSNNDTHLTGAWIAVIVKGITSYAANDSLNCFVKLPEIFKLMTVYLSSEIPEIYYSASQCLVAILTNAVDDSLLLEEPEVNKKTYKSVSGVISSISDIMLQYLTVKYTHCAKEILNVLSVAYETFKYRSNPNFIKPLLLVDQWRVNEDSYLDLKNDVEKVISSAISGMGPEYVLSYLPLNLDNASQEQPGRAWMLPLLRDNLKNARMSTFIKTFIPQITFFESKCEGLPEDSVQRKIFETIIDQFWSTLPKFCLLPLDLRKSFTDEFASELSSILYAKINLRTTICNAFKNLVISNKAYASGEYDGSALLKQRLPITEASKNIDYLSTKSANILAVLFNIYSETAPNARGYILETIEIYLSITSEEDMEKTFNNICGLLKDAMDKEGAAAKKGKLHLTSTLLDLIVCMTKYVPTSSYQALFMIFNSTVSSPNALNQKRAYRIITRLSELEKGSEALVPYTADIARVLLQNAESVHTSSKASRLAAIKTLVELLPADQLSFVVKIVPEVILCTKDVNEKSRELAFEALICMGSKMNTPNSFIDLSQIPGYSPDTPAQPASISEFFKIISAGLIGESQHMVSATVTAYACLVFEFKDCLDYGILMEIYDTIELYLTSNSKEIVKSALGFTKVCVLGLPIELMKDKIPELLPKLLRWSHEHTGHFKSKVKNIVERLIRRFSYEFIAEHFPQEDYRLLANIRKVRNRVKRKDGEEQDQDQDQTPVLSSSFKKGSQFMNAFEEAVYASSDNEDEQEETPNRRNKGSKQFIIESKDSPLDLLDSKSLAKISSTKVRKQNKDAHRKLKEDDMFSFDDEGKLIVRGQKEPDVEEDPLKSVTSGINAYLEAVKHGPIRGQKNKLKFKKGSRAGDMDDNDDNETSYIPKSNNRMSNKIGKSNFKKGPKFKARKKL